MGFISSKRSPYRKVTANTTVLASDRIIGVGSDTAAITITLPTALLTAGLPFIIVDVDGNAATNNITIDTQGAEKIDEADTEVIDTAFGSVGIFPDGSNWFLV